MFKEATWKIEMMAHISKSTTGGYLLESYLSKSPKQKKNIVAKWEHIPKTWTAIIQSSNWRCI